MTLTEPRHHPSIGDRQDVRTLVASVLRGLGYKILEATGPSDALEIADSKSRIDLILSDLIRPEVQGTALASADILIDLPQPGPRCRSIHSNASGPRSPIHRARARK